MPAPLRRTPQQKQAMAELLSHLDRLPNHLMPPLLENGGVYYDVEHLIPRSRDYHTRLIHLFDQVIPPHSPKSSFVLTSWIPFLFGHSVGSLMKLAETPAAARKWNRQWTPEALTEHAQSPEFATRLAFLKTYLATLHSPRQAKLLPRLFSRKMRKEADEGQG